MKQSKKIVHYLQHHLDRGLDEEDCMSDVVPDGNYPVLLDDATGCCYLVVDMKNLADIHIDSEKVIIDLGYRPTGFELK
jgi:hypothetical protein